MLASQCIPQLCFELFPGKISPMSNSLLTQDGLRYVKKAPGSIITTPRAEAMMSCFKCGKFAFRTSMTTRRFLGKNHLVCAPKCA